MDLDEATAMETPHKLESSSYQWGNVRGGRPNDAITWFKCTRCDQGFSHRYNIQPDIYKAAKECGFDLNVCAADGLTLPTES